jgi:hypothetical protein
MQLGVSSLLIIHAIKAQNILYFTALQITVKAQVVSYHLEQSLSRFHSRHLQIYKINLDRIWTGTFLRNPTSSDYRFPYFA